MDAGFEVGDGDEAAVSGGLGICSRVGVARRLSLTGGLGGGDDLGKIVASLRISVSRMGITSDAMGW